MKEPLPTLRRAAVALLCAASPACAQDMAGAAAEAAPASAAPVVPAASLSPALSSLGVGSSPAAPSLIAAPSLGAVSAGAAPAAASPSAASPSAASVAAESAPGTAQSASGDAGSRASAPTPASLDAAGTRATPARAPAAESSSPRLAAAPASAQQTLAGAASRMSAAAAVSAAGDSLSVRDALSRVFDAETARGALRAGDYSGSGTGGAASGNGQSARGRIEQEVSIANAAAPADAPGLYLDAISRAKDAFPAAAASSIATVVRRFAARKAEVSLGDLAQAAYAAASSGSAAETRRLLSAFDKWNELLGAPGRPLVSNADELKADVRRRLPADSSDLGAAPAAAASRAAGSIPHVWFRADQSRPARAGASYTAVLPAVSRVPRLPASLAAAFALDRRAELDSRAPAPDSTLESAWRAFAAAPGPVSGARAVYRARRSLGDGAAAAAWAAGKFSVKSFLRAIWESLVSRRPAPADLSSASGRAAFMRGADLARDAADAAARADAALNSDSLTVGRARAALEQAALSASALKNLGLPGARGGVASVRAAFEAAVAGESADARLSAAQSGIIDGPGGLRHWLALLADRADAAARPSLASLAPSLTTLGAPGAGAAADAFVRARGARLTSVALGERLWSRGEGPDGVVRLFADLRAFDEGGRAQISIARADARLASELEDLGFVVDADGAGLRAVLNRGASPDAAQAADAVARGLAAALGRGEAPEPALTALIAAVHRDPRAARALAGELDGLPAFALARVTGLVGGYEALSPVSARVGARQERVVALRDPATGLLRYAAPLAR